MFILLILMFASIAQAIDVQDNVPIVPEFTTSSVPVLNEAFRQNNKRLQAIEEAFGGSDYLGVANGGTGGNLSSLTADSVMVWNGTSIVGTGAGTATYILTSNGAGALPRFKAPVVVPSVLSNVIFSFAGNTNINGRFVSATNTLFPAVADISTLYAYWASEGTSYAEVIDSKWTKISGVSTITVYALLWNSVLTVTTTCLVDIGGASGNVIKDTNTQTLEWKTFTIDVSGLTNGTVYDVSIQLKSSDVSGVSELGSIIAFGS